MGVRGAARAVAVALAASAVVYEAGHAESCLAAARETERARPTKTSYAYTAPGQAVDATGVAWRSTQHHAVRMRGSHDACWSGGAIEGPVAEDGVYECTPEHGWRGSGPCLPFHTTAGLAPEVKAPLTTIEDVRIAHYGDGISLEPESGPVVIRRAWLHDLHDDAVESDFGKPLTIESSLIERAFMAFATRPRSKSWVDQRAVVFTLRDSLVQLHRFTNSYKQRPGHGGFFKWPLDGSGPRFALTGNVFLMNDPGAGQLTLPLADRVVECRNNVLLFAGGEARYRSWLRDAGDLPDGLRDNRARLAALGECYRVVARPSDQSEAAFLAEHWDPLVARWTAAHAAGQAPTGAGSGSTGSSGSSHWRRNPAVPAETSSRSSVTSPFTPITSKPAATAPPMPSR
jgi:hypothetical protein